MSILDIIVIIGILLGIIWGARRGFIGIIVLVTGIIITIILINSFSLPLSELLEKLGISKNYSYTISITSILIISFIIFFIIHLLLKSIIDIFRIGIINRILGAILGGWIIFVLVGSILFFLVRIPLINLKQPLKNSVLAKYSYIHAKNVMILSGTEEAINNFIEGKE
ncbi:MAG: CvpA family protein [Brevinematia bacterium]